MGRPASSGRSFSVRSLPAGPAAAASTWLSAVADSLSCVDRPLPSAICTLDRSKPLSVNTLRTAWAAPANDGSAPVAMATCLAMASASTLSESSSALPTSRSMDMDLTSPSTLASAGALPLVTFPLTPSPWASALAVSSAGVWLRCGSTLVGSLRPPSMISDSIGVK